MDTTPPPSETISSISIDVSVNENLPDIENKDAEMSQLEQDPSKCNNMNINKRARQNSGQINTSTTTIHRNMPSFGIIGSNTSSISTVADRSILRDHRMSVSDSGDSEIPKASDLGTELTSAPSLENVGTSGSHVVSEALESDGDVRTDDDEEEDCSVSEGIDDYDTYYSFNDDDVDAGLGYSRDSYSNLGGSGDGRLFNNNDDPEYFAYECLTIENVEQFFAEKISAICTACKISPSEAKMYLHLNRWSSSDIQQIMPSQSPRISPSMVASVPTHLQTLSQSSSLTSPQHKSLVTSSQERQMSASNSPTATSQLIPSSRDVVIGSLASQTSHKSAIQSPSVAIATHSPVSSRQRSIDKKVHPLVASETFLFCDVCAVTQASVEFSHLVCRHLFCKGCWELHFEYQILQGLSTSLQCMSPNCDSRAHEDFVLSHVTKQNVRDRYKKLAFCDYIRSHPQLRFCPGKNCKYVIKAEKCVHKRAICDSCKTSFCYQCGGNYHAPTDCETIKRWLTKCADDSETANYISAHTKDCPKCNICIEKNGGCNHMQCYHCKHDFCWMCLGDWKTHGSEYYECSRYKENPNIAHESAHAQAREALKKYLHYFERWENHSKSMKLEAQTLAKIKNRINEKVMKSCGTWIDWQYLLDAAALLAKCRYTLQYTYPYAYYMEPSNRKKLFECQQAQLEAEIENLSWKIEHAEITDRGDLENQIDVAEKRRTSLLKDFLPS